MSSTALPFVPADRSPWHSAGNLDVTLGSALTVGVLEGAGIVAAAAVLHPVIGFAFWQAVVLVGAVDVARRVIPGRSFRELAGEVRSGGLTGRAAVLLDQAGSLTIVLPARVENTLRRRRGRKPRGRHRA